MSLTKKSQVNFGKKFAVVGVVLCALIVLPVFLTTCNSPLGFGKPIDWEPPVLTLDTAGYSTPRYVNSSSMLRGTVKDNVKVNRVILREAGTTNELFRATLLPNNQWELRLAFTKADNDKRMVCEVVAYDDFGNSGEPSIAAITLIVDTEAPKVDYMWISRTDKTARQADFERLSALQTLEISDAKGERVDNVDKYQNGWFRIKALISDAETKVDDVVLRIYDTRWPNSALIEVKNDTTAESNYAPSWLIKEEALLQAGFNLRGQSYLDNYNGTPGDVGKGSSHLTDGQRYYYRADIVATDRSKNNSVEHTVQSDYFFCMWVNGDDPKGVLDRTLLDQGSDTKATVTKRTTLPVQFYDDDTTAWAYANLLTKDQYEALSSGSSDEDKMFALKTKLVDNTGTQTNWQNQTTRIADISVGGDDNSETPWLVSTETIGSGPEYGDFKLVILVGDKKLLPHDGLGPWPTNENTWRWRVYDVSIIDDSLPLIVFDTAAGSPEENTFPKLADGQHFTIKGYTLRENSAGTNGVAHFRMAWIPYDITNGTKTGADNFVDDVKAALAKGSDYPAGVQWWHFMETGAVVANGETALGSPAPSPDDVIAGSQYRRQTFEKTFDILGGLDDKKSSVANGAYQNFTYNGVRENKIKVMVFCAIDKMAGKEPVYRTIRLLGNDTPPILTVYDVSNMPGTFPAHASNPAGGPPDFFAYASGSADDVGRGNYEAQLDAYQKLAGVYTTISTNLSTLNPSTDTVTDYRTYAKDTTLKYWVTASEADQLGVETIEMWDVTRSPSRLTGSTYVKGTSAGICYIETLPEVTARVFQFIAVDTLGNRAVIQCPVAITSTAFLEDITTTTQDGTYGIDKVITLKANFTSQVYLPSTAPQKPQLNVRYYNSITGQYVNESLNTSTPVSTNQGTANSVRSLEFPFTVREGYTGQLYTMYEDTNNGATVPGAFGGTASAETNRPLKTFNRAAIIMDTLRKEEAYVPGYGTMANWGSPAKTLQALKTITLDGIRPVMDNPMDLTVPAGKTNYGTAGAQEYYFKTDDTIGFTLYTDKVITTGGGNNPRIQFYIRETNGTNRGPYYANWVGPRAPRAPGLGAMYFSVTVNNTNTPYDGEINTLSLNTANGTIVDLVGNVMLSTPAPTLPANTRLVIDKTIPPAPATTLNFNNRADVTFNGDVGSGNNNANTVQTYNETPWLGIPTTLTSEPNGIIPEYSLDNGSNWVTYPALFTAIAGSTATGPDPANPGNTVLFINNGERDLLARYSDRAGNVSAVSRQKIHINVNFPKLNGILATVANGWYVSTSGTLTFNLGFEEPVYGTATITLSDRSLTGTGRSVILTSTAITQANASSTVSFAWPLANNVGTPASNQYEMPNGLYVSAVNFNNLTDRFGNRGGTGTGSPTGGSNGTITIQNSMGNGTSTAYTFNLNGGGIKVDTIQPLISAISPVNANGRDNENRTTSVMGTDNRTITITYNEPVQKGIGIITVRPYYTLKTTANKQTHPIPAVFENEGYYAQYDPATGEELDRSSTLKDGYTWVAGLYDIYNSSLLNATDRNALTRSTTGANNSTTINTVNPTMTQLALKPRTGQSHGPYMKMTHGLKKGNGYSGNYSNTFANNVTGAFTTNSSNGPNPQANSRAADNAGGYTGEFMIPDTATKWVLDYQYSITQQDTAAAGVLAEIRRVLDKAHFRWQEIEVTSGNVVIANTATTGTVTITLPEPLHPGLQWELEYKAGTFTDIAGNQAREVPRTTSDVVNNYYFWSRGVQVPVIRVNRRSFDARAVGAGPTNLAPASARTHTDLTGTTAQWTTAGVTVTDLNGWNMPDFTSVHYRMETETPGARIFSGTILGREQYRPGTPANLPIGSVNAAYTGAAGTTIANVSTASTWNVGQSDQAGTWVAPNLIHRSRNNNAISYIVSEYGVNVTRNLLGAHRGFRSYNKDATLDQLNASGLIGTNNIALTTAATSGQQVMTGFNAFEASKNYVVAEARVDHVSNVGAYNTASYSSVRGYEGIFRSVVALRMANGNTPMAVEGSDVKNGMPSISGFPVRDAEESGDNRFIKLFYRDTGTNNNFYWVSTEIVSQWYFLLWGNGGTHMNSGETNNYLTAGYGDLTFAYNPTHH